MSNWRIGLTALALASTLVAGTVVAQQRAISIATAQAKEWAEDRHKQVRKKGH